MQLQSVLSCVSVAMLGIAAWAHVPQPLALHPAARTLILGLLMGAGSVAAMMVPMQVQPGLVFDLRTPLLACAGLFGGPVAAAISAGLALAYRVQLGGAGVWAGFGGIVSVASCGVVARRMLKEREPTNTHLALFTAAVTVLGFMPILLLPSDRRADALQSASLMASLNLACTLLFALALRRDGRLRALTTRDAIYRAIIDTLPDSLNAKDRDSRFVAANPATARLMQAGSAAALIGRSDADFYPGDVACSFRNEELIVLDGRSVGPLDQEVRYTDGTTRWLTSMKTPLRDARGRVTGIITHNRDVTEHRKLERELQQTQGYLQQAMASMADGLVLFDRAGVIQFCNEQYQALFPRTRDLRVPGARLADILRAAVERGEETPKSDLAAWVAERVEGLPVSRDWVIDLNDGRVVEARTRPVPGDGVLVVYTDVTSRARLERDLLRRASQDGLTGLANRAEFDFQLRAAHQRALADGVPFAVLMMDLDGFKAVNDTFGHDVGDRLLIDVARRLQGSARTGDIVARLGGDEFALLIAGRNVDTSVRAVAERVLLKMRPAFDAEGTPVTPGGSLGVAVWTENLDLGALMRRADQALYAAKRGGGRRWCEPHSRDQAPAPPAEAA